MRLTIRLTNLLCHDNFMTIIKFNFLEDDFILEYIYCKIKSAFHENFSKNFVFQVEFILNSIKQIVTPLIIFLPVSANK